MTPPVTKTVLMLGATGTAGQATLAALLNAGHRVICLIRPRSAIPKGFDLAEFRVCDITDPKSLRQDGLRGDVFDAVVSCLASRSGLPADAWAIDHDVHQTVLSIAKDTGIAQMVLLSAICVQKPKLEFQKAKLAFEQALTSSGLTYSIVRPTAFFKSLSGQFERVKQGKPFLVFGDGQLTACKPISDRDLGQFIARCLVEPELQNRVLPIGGPGPALSARDQGTTLFAALNMPPKFRHVPVAVLDAIIAILRVGGTFYRPWRDKAQLAQIGRYYGTESMLVWDEKTGAYDPDATPETGCDTLAEHYADMAAGRASIDLGDHAVF